MKKIGLRSSDVEIVGRTAEWIRYRLPQKFVRRNRHPVCIGQKQRWFLLRLKREDVRFAFDSTGGAGIRSVALVAVLGAGARSHLLQASGVFTSAGRAGAHRVRRCADLLHIPSGGAK